MLRARTVAVLAMIVAATGGARGAGVDPRDDPGRNRLRGSPSRHVRGIGGVMNRLLAEGTARSRTFADLVDRLNRSDVIVYAERSRDLPGTVAGRMLFLPSAHPRIRYVRVQIRADAALMDAVAVLAHELRHALELADAPEVRDEAALILLYQRIGEAGPGVHQYDTAAARAAGRQVRQELVGL